MNKHKYIVRCGDDAPYREFDDLEEVAYYLTSFGVRRPLCRHNEYGIAAPGFTGNNYISLYVAPDFQNPHAGVSDDDLGRLERLMPTTEG